MRQALKSLYLALVAYDFEQRKLIEFVRAGAGNPPGSVLDVGCGYGRLLRPLSALGIAVTGLDENASIVQKNRAEGLACVTPSEFERSSGQFDVLVLSHVIEHLAPDGLVALLDRYLDRLRPGGVLVVASPLESAYFYEDLDHVRPYPPSSLQMAFGPGTPQSRHHPRNRLVLEDLWFRRAHFRPVHWRARRLGGPGRWLPMLLESFGAVAFHASFGLIGKTDGWVGAFRKA